MRQIIHCAIFDFDGTLVDSNQIKYDAFLKVTAELPGAKEILEDILSDPDFGDRYAVFKYLEEFLPVVRQSGFDGDMLAKRYTRVCTDAIIIAPEMPGASEAIRKLTDMGLLMAISSATPERDLCEIVNSRGIASYFDEIMGGPRSKVEHVREIMGKYGLDPSEIIYVGDSETDRLTALEIGCGFVGVGNSSERFEKVPTILIDNLGVIAGQINQQKLT